MGAHHDKSFPGESSSYRVQRDTLLAAEKALRVQSEEVAALRRALPQGGAPSEDYEFTDCASGKPVKLSELFEGGKTSLAVYSFMYAEDAEAPCPMCTSLLDGLNGQARHIGARMNLAVAAKASPEKLNAWANKRGWSNLRLLSSGGNTYNVDYLAEDADGNQWPMMNVFQKNTDGAVNHFWGSELFWAEWEDGQHARHVDQLWPMWNVLDLSPEGRGADTFPALEYE